MMGLSHLLRQESDAFMSRSAKISEGLASLHRLNVHELLALSVVLRYRATYPICGDR